MKYVHKRTYEFIKVIKNKNLVVKYKTSLNEIKYMSSHLLEENYNKR